MDFQALRFEWNGEAREVSPDRQLRLIAEVEGVLRDYTSGSALAALVPPDKRPPGKGILAAAYAPCLRCAGFDVTDADVFHALAEEEVRGAAAYRVAWWGMVYALLALVFPPVHRMAVNAGADALKDGDAPGNGEADPGSADPDP